VTDWVVKFLPLKF